MALSESQAASLVEYIDRVVRDLAAGPKSQGIIDLLNQWRSDVEAGRSIERKLVVRPGPGLDEFTDVPRARATTTSGDFIGKQDYSAIEQLDMLVAALGIAFIAPQMMASRFLDMIAHSSDTERAGPQPDFDIHLVGVGDAGESDAARSISSQSIAQSQEATINLGRLLTEISEEAELTPRRLSDRALI